MNPLPEDPPPGEGPAKRQDILRAGRTLFSTQGFASTTSRELAAEAQVSLRTLFKYFANKEAILDALLHELFLELRGGGESFPRVLEEPGPSAAQWYEKIARNRLAAFGRFAPILRVVFAELPVNAPLRDLVTRHFADEFWQRSLTSARHLQGLGGLKPEVDPLSLLRVVLSIHVGMFLAEHVVGIPLDHEHEIAQNTLILMHGVGV